MKSKLNIHQLYALIFKFRRKRRHDYFETLLCLKPTDRLLDVGGHPQTWITRPQIVSQVDCLNIVAISFDTSLYQHHKIQMMVGDGCELPMKASSYDVVFSNSVIEHVGGWSDQVKFASEVRRVGQRLWIQTPAYECFIEPHLLAPFIHWLPMPYRKKLARRFTLWGLLEKPSQTEIDKFVSGVQLLRKRQMADLFPDCEIITERMFFIFPKSHIAVRR